MKPTPITRARRGGRRLQVVEDCYALLVLLRFSEGERELARTLHRVFAAQPGVASLAFGPNGYLLSVRDAAGRADALNPETPALPALTRRQEEVLRVMSEGVTEREVARRLGISERAVQIHVANLFRILGATSHFQLGLTVAGLGLT